MISNLNEIVDEFNKYLEGSKYFALCSNYTKTGYSFYEKRKSKIYQITCDRSEGFLTTSTIIDSYLKRKHKLSVRRIISIISKNKLNYGNKSTNRDKVSKEDNRVIEKEKSKVSEIEENIKQEQSIFFDTKEKMQSEKINKDNIKGEKVMQTSSETMYDFDLQEKKKSGGINENKNKDKDKKPINKNGVKISSDKPKIDENSKKEENNSFWYINSIFRINESFIFTSSLDIDCEYIVVPLERTVTSHNPNNFSINKEYPNLCQQRHYESDVSEQLKVINGAKNFKSELVTSNNTTATDGPPIAYYDKNTDKLIIIGGNGRTMMLKLLTEKQYNEYEKGIYEYVLTQDKINLTDEIDSFSLFRQKEKDKLILIRLINPVDSDDCAKFSNLLNTNLTQSVNNIDLALSYSRQLSETDVIDIVSVFDKYEVDTVSQLNTNVKAVKEVIFLLKRANIITDSNINSWIDNNNTFSKSSVLVLADLLISIILPTKNLLTLAQNYTNVLLKSLSYILELKYIGGDWNIIEEIKKAITYESSRRSQAMDKVVYISQVDVFNNEIDNKTILIWNLLDAGQVKFKNFAKQYVLTAKREQGDSFGFTSKTNPIELLNYLHNKTSLNDNFDIVTLKDNLKLRLRYLPIEDSLLRLFLFATEQPFTALIWGNRGAGKTSFGIKIGVNVSKFKNVVYVSSEESISSGLIGQRAKVLNLLNNDLNIVDIRSYNKLKEFLDYGSYNFIIINSINKFDVSADKIVNLCKKYPKISFIYITHSDKGGNYNLGKSSIGQDVDIEIKVEDKNAIMLKNRLSPIDVSSKTYKIM